jgi:hypothetical protein
MNTWTEKESDSPAALSPPLPERAGAFGQLMRAMVADCAPQVFAVVQVHGEEEESRIVAWGMAFDDHAEVVTVDGSVRMSLPSPERAVRRFAYAPQLSAQLVWPGRSADTSPPSEADAA